MLNAMKFFRKFDEENPGLSSRLELGSSWEHYAKEKFVELLKLIRDI